MKRPGGPSSSSDAKLTVGRKFAQQLEGLIANLNSTQPRYIRCVKPNQQKRPDLIAARLVEEQLTYSGVFEAVGPRWLPSESQRTTNNCSSSRRWSSCRTDIRFACRTASFEIIITCW